MRRLILLVLPLALLLGVAPSAQAASILITGSRDGQRVVVTGSLEGFGPATTFIPVYLLDGRERVGIPFTSSGEISWQRKTRKPIEVWIEAQDPFDPWNPVRSNSVSIPGCVRYVCP